MTSFLNYAILKINFGFFLMKLVPRTINAIVLRGRDLLVVSYHIYTYLFLQFIYLNHFCLFKILNDITAVDFPQRFFRFEVIYNLLSLVYNSRISIKTSVTDVSPLISICSFYSNANWFEREVWDMFGIFFYFHPNMSRILTDYGFVGHPLRKDFPVIGFFDVSYSIKGHSIIKENINNINDKKNFACDNPWIITF